MNFGKRCLQLYRNVERNLILNNALSRGYAFKSDLKIKWVRPEKIACHKPEKSGDLQPMPSIDRSQYQLEFRNSKELENADDLVKKLFTLEYAPRVKSTHLYIREMVGTVQRHPLDKGSIESRIARWTGAIRTLQEVMDNYPRNKVLKVKLKELIDKRKKHLKYLRRWDYKKFEWILENLNIVYKPPPPNFHWITRKDSLRKLTDKYCNEIVQKRLDSYRSQLQEEQPAFLNEKLRALEFIRAEQKDCGLEVTVTQEDIDEVKQRIGKLTQQERSNENY